MRPPSFCVCSGSVRQPNTFAEGDVGRAGRICENCGRWLNPAEPLYGRNNRNLGTGRLLSAHEST